MAFGKKGGKHAAKGESPSVADLSEATDLSTDSDAGVEGPFDIEDFDSAEVAAIGRLDLGSVLIPTPPAGQVQVEVTETGQPGTIWVVTPNGRFTIAAYAAPKTAGLWREVAGELAETLRNDTPNVSIESGPWGREVVGTAGGAVRFIGVDGYRWMIRCVANGTPDSLAALTVEARNALADTVVRRGDVPLPVRSPLPIELPEPMLEQLRAAAQQAAAQVAAQIAQQAQQAQQAPQVQQGAGGTEQPPKAGPSGPPPVDPVARRSAQGSAMQQLRTTSTITGG
jgi:Protein of unknown function (DUF3710)